MTYLAGVATLFRQTLRSHRFYEIEVIQTATSIEDHHKTRRVIIDHHKTRLRSILEGKPGEGSFQSIRMRPHEELLCLPPYPNGKCTSYEGFRRVVARQSLACRGLDTQKSSQAR